MYIRSFFSRVPSFHRRSILPLQNLRFSSIRDSNVALRAEKPQIQRYSLPSDSDSFLVDRSRLTRSENLYQKFASVLSVFSVLGLLSFPLVLFFYLDNKHKSISKIRLKALDSSKPKTVHHSEVPVLTSSRSLSNLLDSKTPVIIFYFVKDDKFQNKLLIRLTRLILEEIRTLYQSNLNVVSVDVNQLKGPISPTLKSELSNSGNFLYHLLIPMDKDPILTTLAPLVTVQSFLDQVLRILDPLGFKLTETSENRANSPRNLPSKSFKFSFRPLSHSKVPYSTTSSQSQKRIEEVDESLSSLRACLFELELKNVNPESLLDMNSLSAILHECRRLNSP